MKIKVAYTYFAIASFAAIAFRLFLLIFSIDSASGFVKTGYSAISVFMLVLIALALALVFVFSYKTKVAFSKPKRTSILQKIVSFAFAVSILVEILFSPFSDMLPERQAQIDMVLGLFAFASIILLTFKKELRLKISPLFSVAILIFFIFRLICVFTIFSTFSMIIDIVFELFSNCGLLIGFLFYSKCKCLSEEDINKPLCFASLLFSSALGLTASVPKVLLNVTGNAHFLHINSTPMYSVFFASLFLLLYSLKKFRSK